MSGAAIHGGDVWRVAAEYSIPAERLLDFSANINPRGLPPGARRRLAEDAADFRLMMRYPDPAAGALRAALSERLGVPAERLIVGEGAEALLAAALRSFQARRCLTPVPAFSEYARACAACGTRLDAAALDPASNFRLNVARFCELLGTRQWDAAIVNNPHNPSGALLERAEVGRILDAAAASGTRLLLDEAFIDYAEEASAAHEAGLRPGVIVVRSLTKFYGCPALRVGYAAGAPAELRRLADCLPTWPVSTLALNALTEALKDCEYAGATLRENARERARLAGGLAELGTRVFPSAANYLLIRLPEGCGCSARVRQRLIGEHAILVRNCDSYEGLEEGRYIRVAVRLPEENGRLLAALESVWKGPTT